MFQFRLQRVLELREKREQETATRLAEARGAADSAREAQNALETVRSESMERLARVHAYGAPVGELRNVSYMLEHLNRQIQEAQSVTASANETVRALVEEFTAAFRDRRVLDLLRERQHTEWKASEAHSDRQAMDGIALTRFSRRDLSPTSEAP